MKMKMALKVLAGGLAAGGAWFVGSKKLSYPGFAMLGAGKLGAGTTVKLKGSDPGTYQITGKAALDGGKAQGYALTAVPNTGALKPSGAIHPYEISQVVVKSPALPLLPA